MDKIQNENKWTVSKYRRAEDYANIRSYIETCRIYGINVYVSLTRLVEGNPYIY